MSDVTNENIIDQMQREIDALEAKVEELGAENDRLKKLVARFREERLARIMEQIG